MQTVIYNISQAVANAIIHSLWQALLVYTLLRLLILLLPNTTASIKYKLAAGAMLAVSGWFAITVIAHLYQSNWDVTTSTITVNQHNRNFDLHLVQQAIHQAYQSYSISYRPYLPYISLFYTAGLFFQLVRLFMGRQRLRQLRQSIITDDFLQKQINLLARQAGVKKEVTSGLSNQVTTPCVAGYLQPIIFLPITAYARLSADEIKALLLHELAHIKRNDYLINLIQQLVLTTLFFNPLVWLINRTINQEREHCCDDVVIQHTGEPLLYAQALLKVQEAQADLPSLALAATGQKNYLLNRIHRIMETKKTMINPRHVALTLLLMAGSLSSIAWLEPTVKDGKITVKKVRFAELVPTFFQDTIIKPAEPAAPPRPPEAPKPPKFKSDKYGFTYQDKEMEKLAADIEKHGNAIGQLYASEAFTKIEKDLNRHAQNVDQYFNNPDMQRLMQKQQDYAAAIGKATEDPEAQQLQKQIGQLSTKIGEHYSSARFLEMQKQLTNASNELSQAKANSAEYKKKKAQLDKLTAELNAYQNDADIKSAQAELGKVSEQLGKHYQSAALKEQHKALQGLDDSLKSLTNNMRLQLEQKQMAGVQQQLKAFQTNPKLLKEQAALKKATERLQQYQNSPAFKKRMAKAANAVMTERQELRELPELPEKPELPELKEVPEPKL
ncbi:M48 family metalloprotease [Mucilaginibacter sp. Bleaf8]|uniref:M56 family metallopeptidase n=1 Tax=Mucilaginibacter sp. Bleaf8 TaxID=2834430 RepID=UPI001BCF3B33|nr:M56 family metallopeptidase [Mucilaginibacter sp. Bleaf8]MBS7566932.1 M48 family metalloprotease [Mucilaginibacter sp. Bleaf8]